jgi:hypothetical protein
VADCTSRSGNCYLFTLNADSYAIDSCHFEAKSFISITIKNQRSDSSVGLIIYIPTLTIIPPNLIANNRRSTIVYWSSPLKCYLRQVCVRIVSDQICRWIGTSLDTQRKLKGIVIGLIICKYCAGVTFFIVLRIVEITIILIQVVFPTVICSQPFKAIAVSYA